MFGNNDRVMIIAEIGNNHEGSFDLAKLMVKAAADCGADAVKFQTFRTEHYVSKTDMERYNRLKKFELSETCYIELKDLAHSLNLLFISTPFDLISAAFLRDLVDVYKISSSDNTFYPLLSQVALIGKPILLSTGLADLQQVQAAVKLIKNCWHEIQISSDLALLHCVSAYPAPSDQLNLKVIKLLQSETGCPVGYSDHTLGTDAAVIAVAAGATILEKHFTLDKEQSDFRDHQLSADPTEMKELVMKIRAAETILGKSIKAVQPCEENNTDLLRRSIVAAKDLPAGYILKQEDITWTRPAGGYPPGKEHLVIGKTLKKSIEFGHRFQETDLE